MRRGSLTVKPGVLSFVIAGLIFLGLNASVASAQVLYGSIVGTMTDQSNAVIARAVVTATNSSTGLTRQATTDQTGYYAIANLLEGSYDLSIVAPGFKPVTQKSVDVRINNVTRVDLNLEVGGVTEAITVEASAALLQTTKADVNVNWSRRR